MKPKQNPELEEVVIKRKGRPPGKVLSDTPAAVAARERRASTATNSDGLKSLRDENIALKQQAEILLKILAKAYEV